MNQILANVNPWHEEVVKGLRKVRQLLKDGYSPVSYGRSEAIRQSILRTELETERVEQALLFAQMSGHTSTEDRRGWTIAADNILLYFSMLGVQLDAQNRDNLRIILCQVFPDDNSATISEYLHDSGQRQSEQF